MTRHTAANTILIVEDNPDDFYAIQRVFERAEMHNPVVHCETGEAALDYLHGRGSFAGTAVVRPALILLDINLPGIKGTDLLKTIRSDLVLQSIPIIMLTSSNDQRDVADAFAGQANSYLIKPATFLDFLHAIQRIKSHWFEIVLTPRS